MGRRGVHRAMLRRTALSRQSDDLPVPGMMPIGHGQAVGLRGADHVFRGMDERPEVVAKFTSRVKIIGVNRATLEMYKAKSHEDFRNGLSAIFTEESYPVFKEELIALSEGRSVFESEKIPELRATARGRNAGRA